ncbi:MAG: Wzz/FepE/Etk N-terminal domain-containing protein [Gammaproteobacteria bacterium]|nr:Wzz/FepE/Etk N-terminal domain-containing protein [Gammaproteobacteria bacterium]
MQDKNHGPLTPEEMKQLPQAVYFAQPPMVVDDEINLLDYWRVLVEYKKLIVLLTVLATALALTVALLMTPVYRAEVMVMPADDKTGGGLSALAGQFGGLASLAGIELGGGGGQTAAAMATLNSRAFTEMFINEHKLMPVLFAQQWDAQNKHWLVEADAPTAWDAFKVFDGIRTISEDKKSGMITLSVEWTDPALAAAWANQLIERINAHQQAKAITEAKESIAYLRQELEQTGVVEMRQSIFNLIEAQTKQIMLANVREDYAFKVIDPAVVPEEKIKPKRALIVVLGFMVGLMLGVFTAFFVSFIKKQRQAV